MAKLDIAAESTAREIRDNILSFDETRVLKQKLDELLKFLKELNKGE